MLRIYLKAALRPLLKDKRNTILNMLGLTLGMSGTILLFSIVNHGNSFDRYHTKSDRIYRVVSKWRGNNGYAFTEGIPAPLPEAIKNDFANEVEAVTFTSYRPESLITVLATGASVKKYDEAKGVAFTEPSFFKIFDRKIIINSSEKILDRPGEAVISTKWALKYFGKEDVLGERIAYNDVEYMITSVMEDYPTNTDFPFDLLLSYATIKRDLEGRSWGDLSDNDNCYFLMKPDISVSDIEARIPAFIKKYQGENFSPGDESTFILQPLKDLHSDSRFGTYNSKLPKEAQIAFSLVSIFLLATACINFINLTTAEAIKRTREVAIRKLLGSARWQLIGQFMSEAFIVTILSVILSLMAAKLLVGFIAPFIDVSLDLTSNKVIWLFLVGLTITVTVLSGLYPAITLSSFKPVLALKGVSGFKTSSTYTMRNVLVVFQLFISQIFIVATIIVVKQMDFIQSHDVGFSREAIITIPIPAKADTIMSKSQKAHTLKNQLLMLPGIEKASLNYAPPAFKAVVGATFSLAGSEEEYSTQVKQVDGDYIDLFHLRLLAGEKLPDLDTATGLIVNEKLVKVIGYKNNDDIIGKQISFWGTMKPVIGVVNDFNTSSLSRPIDPVILFNNVSSYQSISLKLSGGEIQQTIDQVKRTWEVTYPEFIFSYQFLDDQISNMYKSERRTIILLIVFSAVAIFISCLGLFGLIQFMANQKAKEIGVRKILGASVENIVVLFARQFIKLTIIGFLLAAPPLWFLMTSFLEEFAYRIPLQPALFLLGLVSTFVITALTVGLRSWRASIVNPVDSLRSE